MVEAARYVFMRGILRTWSVAATAVALATTLSACGEEDKPVTLPSLTPSPTPTTTTGLTDEEQIRTIYTEYAVSWMDAQDLPEAKREEFLAQWTADPHRATILQGLTDQEKHHQHLAGKPVTHIFSVRITRSMAIVDDCSDGRKVVRKDTKTGKVVERFDRYWYVAGFKRTKHGWRMYKNDLKDESCAGR